jgi:hypothetical protein
MPQTAHFSQPADARPLDRPLRAGLDRALRLLRERSSLLATVGNGALFDRLEGLLEPLARPRSEERCELCDLPLLGEHHHLVNLETRSLLCACPACSRLFTRKGAAGGKFLAVPKRYVYVRDLRVSAAQWETLRIPVGLAFFLYHGALGQLAACYPGPAGTVESRLPLSTWAEMARTNPQIATLKPDIEALVIHRQVGEHGASHAGYVVPIDACHELLGRLRSRWQGIEGGDEAWREVEAFFFEVRARSCERG